MRHFRKAVVIAGVAALVPLLSPAKTQTWVEVRSPNFIVVSNAGGKSARKTALQFEQIRAVFRQSLKWVSERPSPMVTVLAVKDESSMRELLPEYWAKGHMHPAGIFMGQLNQFYAAVQLEAQGDNPYETFYHEYYHAITAPYSPDMPVWLGEGLAEFYGHTQIDDTYAGLGQASPLYFQQMTHGGFIPLDVLFKVDRFSPYYNETNKTSLFYIESWALCHYLLFGDRMAHRDMMDNYLTALAHGKQADEAVAAFGDLKKLQSDLLAYARSSSFFYMRLPAPSRISDADLKVRTLSDSDALAYRGGFAAIRGHANEAISLLQQAIQLDPGNALAYQHRAFTEFFQNQHEKALESVSAAIRLDPQNSFTRYLRAYLQTDGSGIASGNPQVEEDLRKAIAVSPDFSPPYGLLAVYLAANDQNLPEAVGFARKAIAFEPGNSNYELALAQVLVRTEKPNEAQAAARSAIFLSRTPAEKANAESFLSYLDRMRDYKQEVAAREAEEGRVEAVQTPGNEPRFSERKPDVTFARGMQLQISISTLSDTSGVDLTPYLKGMVEAIRLKLLSRVSKMNLDNQRNLAVEFAVLRDGKIAGSKIASSSQDSTLDQAILATITAAGPLPALPSRMKAPSLRLNLGVSCNPEPAP